MADEIVRSLHQRCKSPFVGVSQPLSEGNRRLIDAGVQKQLFGLGWKRVADRAGGKYCIAAKPDQCVQVASGRRVRDDKFPLFVGRCGLALRLELQHRLDTVQACRIQPRIDAGQPVEPIAVAEQRDENKIGVHHPVQRSHKAVADLVHIIILPGGRKRGGRDEIAQAALQVVGIYSWLGPRHELPP
jgi:hypothetical protein